jgi:hypothetical protein
MAVWGSLTDGSGSSSVSTSAITLAAETVLSMAEPGVPHLVVRAAAGAGHTRH